MVSTFLFIETKFDFDNCPVKMNNRPFQLEFVVLFSPRNLSAFLPSVVKFILCAPPTFFTLIKFRTNSGCIKFLFNDMYAASSLFFSSLSPSIE